MNKMISWTGKIVPLAVLAGVSFIFWLLKQLGCSVGECCMIIATVAMVFVTYRGNQQNKVGIEASQRQSEAATEQTKAIQQQIEISQQQAKAAKQQADIARKELEEAQTQREEMYRPRLVVYFEKKNRYSLKLLVKNVGQSPAYHIKVKCEAPWLERTFRPDCWKYLNPISDSNEIGLTPLFYTELRPGQEISLWRLNRDEKSAKVVTFPINCDNFLTVSKIEQDLMREQPLKVTVKYENDKKEPLKPESFIVNPSKAEWHFQFAPEDTKIFSPLFTPTQADFEEMMQFVDDTVALHLPVPLRGERTLSEVVHFSYNPTLQGITRDLGNILPDILDGRYEAYFSRQSESYKPFVEVVKTIWMQLIKTIPSKVTNHFHEENRESNTNDFRKYREMPPGPHAIITVEPCDTKEVQVGHTNFQICEILRRAEMFPPPKMGVHEKELHTFIGELKQIACQLSLRKSDEEFRELQEAELSYMWVKEAFKNEPDARKRQALKGKFQSTLFKFVRELNTEYILPYFASPSFEGIKKEFDKILEDFKEDTVATQPTSDA